jgi:hypothetical protein
MAPPTPWGLAGKHRIREAPVIMTVGELRSYLDGFDADVPVVIDVNVGRWYLRVENLDVTSDENATNDSGDVEVQIGWNPEEQGWVLSQGDELREEWASRPSWPFPTSTQWDGAAGDRGSAASL